MAEAARKMKLSAMIPDWSQLPQKLLHLISKKLDNCFDVVHARSVCPSWRSSFPFPSCLLRPSYSLPSFANFPVESKEFCTLEKVHVFLFRVRAPATAALPFEYFMGGVGQDKSKKDHTSPLQCSVKVEIPGYDPTLMNMLDCQIIPLGYHYRMIGWEYWDPNKEKGTGIYGSVVFLPLNKEGEFVVILNNTTALLVLTSAEMKWKRLMNVPDSICMNLVSFKGGVYAIFINTQILVIDPHSLEVTPLLRLKPVLPSLNYLVPCGNDELFLVELTCRVSRLDEEAGKWVEVTHLGDRVFFVEKPNNSSFSAKELPVGCGFSGNSILHLNLGNLAFPYKYKYRIDTGRVVDKLDTWRYSREEQVTILNAYPVVAFHVD